MARLPENKLHNRTLTDGTLLLDGRMMGRRIRKRFKTESARVLARAEYDMKLLAHQSALAGAPSLRLTHLSPERLRDAEAADRLIGKRSLLAVAAVGLKHMPPEEDVTCERALTEWLGTLKARKRSERTLDKNTRRVRTFITGAKVANLVEITPLMVERVVLREGCADFTRLTDGQVLKAWLRFCVQRRWLAISPFEIDMKDLSATAAPKEAARILTPEQCQALLAAAQSYAGGVMLPYAILALWCFMRDSEIQLTPRSKMKLDAATPIIEVDTRKRRTVKYRTVTIPANVLPILRAAVANWDDTTKVPFSRVQWTAVRDVAGLVKRAKPGRNKRRKLLASKWQSDIARHTGISYLYQKTGDIREVCRQAGNKTDVSFRHYLNLPAEGAADKFYAVAPQLSDPLP